MTDEEKVVARIKDIQEMATSPHIPISDIGEEFEYVDEDYLRNLANLGHISYTTRPNGEDTVRMASKGTQFLRDQELIRQSKVSSASETVFTYALLTFSWIQVQGMDINIDSAIVNGIFLAAIGVSSLFGLGNILEVGKMRLEHLDEKYVPEWFEKTHIMLSRD